MTRRLAAVFGARPWLVAAALTVVSYAVIGPWGNFPLNDDWTFSRVALKLVQNGRFFVDVPSGPSLVIQSYASAPFIMLFGFSHLMVRMLTMVLGFVGLWAVGSLLESAQVAPWLRAVAVTVVAFNPLYMYLSASFMTELWGHVPALLGVVIWFRGRARAKEGGPAIPLHYALGSAALISATFWTRQYASFAFPAVWASSLLHLLYRRSFKELKATAPAFGLTAALFVAVVAAYFPWAKATGNFRPEFAMPLDEMKRFDGPMLVLQTCIASFYMTAFFLPALLLFRWGTRVPRLLAFAAVGVVLVGGAYSAMRVAEAAGISNAKPADVHHKVMPFDGNVLYNAGIGPLTLKDAYFFEVPRPTWPVERWKVIQWLLVAAAAAWAPVIGWTASALRALKGKPGWELMMHGLLFAAGEFLVTVQASKFYVWDRYYIPCVLGLALFLPVLIQVTREREAAPVPGRAAKALFAAALLPVALYTVLGLHDQFRWNEVRWSLVKKALDMGASTGNIDGGYEVTGWINQDDFQAGRMPPSCLGPCACAMDWYCSDGSYMLTFVRLHGYDVVASEQPDYWLANGPPMLLLRRWPDYDRR